MFDSEEQVWLIVERMIGQQQEHSGDTTDHSQSCEGKIQARKNPGRELEALKAAIRLRHLIMTFSSSLNKIQGLFQSTFIRTQLSPVLVVELNFLGHT